MALAATVKFIIVLLYKYYCDAFSALKVHKLVYPISPRVNNRHSYGYVQ